jgi:hypothetical protein
MPRATQRRVIVSFFQRLTLRAIRAERALMFWMGLVGRRVRRNAAGKIQWHHDQRFVEPFAQARCGAVLAVGFQLE